ncbi:Metacaspase-1, partial [Durusdinium trenchii]
DAPGDTSHATEVPQTGPSPAARPPSLIPAPAPAPAPASVPVRVPVPVPVPVPMRPLQPTPVPALLPEEACLLDHRPLPEPVVYGPDGVWMEVSFLNQNRKQSSYRTTAKCPAKQWKSDLIGRPILESTETLLTRAKLVGHPRNGMLNPQGDFAVPKRCSHPVPKILHFIWLCSPLTDGRADHVRGFAKNNPDFQIFYWTDSEIPASARSILETARNTLPIEVKDAYSEAQSFQSWEMIQYLDKFHNDNKNPGICAVKSHFFRLEAPLKYGGIYIDMDHVSSRGFDEVGGELWRWPFVTHKVCGANIGNHIFSGDKGSWFLDFAVKVIIERCTKLSSCNVLEGTGPPPFSMSALRYNASDIAFIGLQFMADTGLAVHKNEHSWR